MSYYLLSRRCAGFDGHAAIARWTFPLWLYVALTCVGLSHALRIFVSRVLNIDAGLLVSLLFFLFLSNVPGVADHAHPP